MIAQASPAAGPLRADPSKRVNYTLGLVLGVDEFQQDQLYHAAGRRGHNRLLHGYGTVWGLRVAAASENGDPEIQVEPGIAIDPCGREICVPDRMCVKLTRWIDRHRPALEALYPQPALQPLPLAVVLCHRECPTDTVPVPGEPCRTQDDAMAASRIREGFELKLALRDDAPWGSPPVSTTGLTVFRLSQPEEQAVRAFGLILARVQSTTDELLGADGEARLLAEIYALREAADEGTLASPPASTDDPILLPAGDAPEILRRAFRLWVTEVRPAIRALEDPGAGCGESDGECCVLLAELDLNVTAEWAVAANQPPLREDLRPYLLHTRLLQEWLIAAGGEEGRPDVDTWATVQILGPSQVRAWVHHDEWVNLADAVTFVLNEEVLAPGSVTLSWAGIRNVWDVVIDRVMSDGDVVELRFHTDNIQLLAPPPADPTGWTPESGTQQSPPRTVADELKGPSGEYLDRYGWTLSAFTVYNKLEGGDLAGEYDLPIVARIQTVPVNAEAPQLHDVLHFRDGQWFPDQLDQWNGDLRGAYPGTIVTRIQEQPVSPTDPVDQNYLVFIDPAGPATGQWEPRPLPPGQNDVSGTYPNLTVTGIQGSTVAGGIPGNGTFLRYNRPGPARGTWDIITLAPQGGDVTGAYPVFTVTSLRGTPVDPTPPNPGQVLAFVGGSWIPRNAVSLLPAAGGDLRGSYPDPQVVGLRNRPIADEAPAEGNVLVYREGGSPPGGVWVPEAIAFSAASDLGGAYPDSRIARLQGNPVDAADPQPGQILRFEESSPAGEGRWVLADLPADGAAGPAGGDLTGTYPNPRIAQLQGTPVDAADPLPGQILRFEDSSPTGNGRWVPADLPAGGTTGPAAGDLTGTYPGPQVARLQGRTLAAPNPTDGQILRYQESSPPGNGRWVAVAPPAGATGPAGGDLTGTYPGPRIESLQQVPLKAPTPGTGQYLHFNDGAWVPGFAVEAPGGRYAIVAAGRFNVQADGPPVPLGTVYNGLVVDLFDAQASIFQLSGFKYTPETHEYVVKGLWELGVVLVAGATARGPLIRLFRLDVSGRGSELHLEVSEFPREGGSIGRFTTRTGTEALRAPGTAETALPAAPKTAAKTTTRKRPPTG